MIDIQNVTFQYKGSEQGSVRGLSLSVKKGETVLLCGSSGAGKTTILRLINGLIPHYYKGELSGSVFVDGNDIGKTELYDLAGIVGTVFQNPRSQFFSVDTDGEVVFGPENIGLPPEEIRRRKKLITKEMNLSPLLSRSLFELSGGEKQKIACASVAALFPDVILLDEPSSNLDWKAIGELRRVIQHWKEQGKTILISEHRLWFVRDLADRVLYIRDGQIAKEWGRAEFCAMGEDTLRQLELRSTSVDHYFTWTRHDNTEKQSDAGDICFKNYYFNYERKQRFFRRKIAYAGSAGQLTLSIPEFHLRRGSVTGLIGSNGAGKSTLLRCICGLEKNCIGRIESNGMHYSGKKILTPSDMSKRFCAETPEAKSRRRFRRWDSSEVCSASTQTSESEKYCIGNIFHSCYLVMQDVNHQLFTDSVDAEVLLSMDRPEPQTAADILKSLGLSDYAGTHPMALSGGQKQRVAIASAMAAKVEILLFDEPTSGLDYVHMCSVAGLLQKLAREGKTILVSTHDPELLALCADEVIHIESGKVTEQYALNKQTAGRLGAFFAEQCAE